MPEPAAELVPTIPVLASFRIGEGRDTRQVHYEMTLSADALRLAIDRRAVAEYATSRLLAELAPVVARELVAAVPSP